jgi:gamma-glutamyltranspeptidase/glutathione hydrolase
MLENEDLQSLGHNSPDYIHLVVEALNLSFSDREHFYGDPDFVNVPIDTLLSKPYTQDRRQQINPKRAFGKLPPPGNPWALQAKSTSAGSVTASSPHGEHTYDTSYTCVVDKWGNGFSATPSDASFWTPIVPGLGFLMSGRGSQSWLEPEHPSSLQAWKRPRLTPNPAMAFRNGKLLMPFGCPGGDAQCQAMVQMFLNIVAFGMDPQAAIEAPRFTSSNFPNSFWPHAYLPGRLNVEGRIAQETIEALARRGHDIVVKDDWERMSMAVLSTIVVDADAGTLSAGADPRRDTYAIGR